MACNRTVFNITCITYGKLSGVPLNILSSVYSPKSAYPNTCTYKNKQNSNSAEYLFDRYFLFVTTLIRIWGGGGGWGPNDHFVTHEKVF